MDRFQPRQHGAALAAEPVPARGGGYQRGAAPAPVRSKSGIDSKKVAERAEAAAHGDRDALKDLFFWYKDRIYGVALMLLCSHPAAEAVTEDVFVRYVTEPPAAGTSFESWVYRAVVDICGQHMADGAEGKHGSDRLSINEPKRAIAIRRLIAARLSSLPADARVAFVLYEAAGLPYGRISETLGVSAEVVAARLAEARGALASALEIIEFEGWNVG